MLFSLFLMSNGCLGTVNVLWLFLTVPWAGLQCVSVVFPDHTHLLFGQDLIHCKIAEKYIFLLTSSLPRRDIYASDIYIYICSAILLSTKKRNV